MICSFKNKYIFWNTSDFFPYYWRVYICTSLIWFLYVFFHHYMFSPCILVWPLIMINNFICNILLSDLTLLTIFSISIFSYSCHLFIEEKHPSYSRSPSRISHRYFLSDIHFHHKERYFVVVYKITWPLDFQNESIKFSLKLGNC